MLTLGLIRPKVSFNGCLTTLCIVKTRTFYPPFVPALPSVRPYTFDVLIYSKIILIAATRFVNLQKLL